MSLLRGLAVRISATVVQYASPGCKEWAKGLAREVAFIPGDWAALRWALGSVRVLFIYREAPIKSMIDLIHVAEKFAESKRRRDITWISSLLFIFIYGDQFFRATSWMERTGCGLAVLGWILIGIMALIRWRRRLKVPSSDDVIAVIQFYKMELERMCDNFTEMWIGGVGITFVFGGLMLSVRGRLLADPIFSGLLSMVWVGALLLFLQVRRNNRRRLEQLEALLADRS